MSVSNLNEVTIVHVAEDRERFAFPVAIRLRKEGIDARLLSPDNADEAALWLGLGDLHAEKARIVVLVFSRNTLSESRENTDQIRRKVIGRLGDDQKRRTVCLCLDGAEICTEENLITVMSVNGPDVTEEACQSLFGKIANTMHPHPHPHRHPDGGENATGLRERGIGLRSPFGATKASATSANASSPLCADGARVPVAEATPYATVQVFFGTDRNEGTGTRPGDTFGKDRGTGTISYGKCNVSIPAGHTVGQIERHGLWSILRFQFREDPEKHMMLVAVERQDKRAFQTDLSDCIDGSKSKAAFCFVHGYNVSFEDAALRTAQMAYDLKFDGAPIFFSWPSHARAGAYTKDESNINWSEAQLRVFVEDLLQSSGALKLYFIAHSMGNRGLAGVLADLTRERPDLMKGRVVEILLAAPDVDAGVFLNRIAPALRSSGVPTTLYVSDNDLALKASFAVHGHRRAGDASQGSVVLCEGVETVDASDVDTDFLGHSYVTGSLSLIADIAEIIGTGKRASERFLLCPVESAAGNGYWRFRKT